MELVFDPVGKVSCLKQGGLTALAVGTLLSFLGMFLGTTCLSLGSSLLLLLGIPVLMKEWRQLWDHALFKPFLAFLGALVISIIFSEPFVFSKTLLKFRYFLCLFISSFVFSFQPLVRNWILKAAQFLPWILTPLALLQYLDRLSPVYLWLGIPPPPHASGLLTHHSAFGLSMVYLFYLVLPQLSQEHSPRRRLFLLGSCLLCLLAVLCSFSRGALLAWCVSFFTVLLSSKKIASRKILLVFLFASLTISSLLSAPLKERFTQWDRSKFTDRIELLSFAWDEFKAHPFLGHGFGRFALELEKYPERKARAGNQGHSHNIYLDLLAGSGMLGFFTFCWFLVVGFRYLLRKRKQQKDSVWNCAIWGVWVSFLCGGLFDEYFLWSQILIPTMVLLGLTFDWPSKQKKLEAQ